MKLDRFVSNATATLGKLSLDGKFECYICEDAFHQIKLPGKTRIPAGIYEIKLRKLGTSHFDESYSKKFSFHKGMLQLQQVPGYSGVLIHIGNANEDTEGCLLVGKSLVVGAELKVLESKFAYEQLYPKVIAALELGPVHIEIQDNDRNIAIS